MASDLMARTRAILQNRYSRQQASGAVQDDDKQKSTASVGTRIAHTAGDVVGNVAIGLGKGLEGAVDGILGIVGGIGGIFDKDFQNDVKNIIAYDAVGNWYGNALQDATKDSYLNDSKFGNFTENVLQGVGQMLPQILIAIPTGGSSVVAQAASLGYLGVSAAGNATEQAFQEGADYGKGLLYGGLSGITEVATEKMFGGATKGIYGKGVFDSGKTVAKTGVRRVLSNAAEEGVEEMTSEFVNPLLKGVYDKDAPKEFLSGDHVKNILESGAVGAATSVVLGQTSGRLTGDSGKWGDARAVMEQINRLENTRNTADIEGTLTAENERQINQSIKENYDRLSSIMQSATNKQRNRILSKDKALASVVNADGTLSQNVSDSIANMYDGTAQNSDSKAYYKYTSVGLHGKETQVDNDLREISQHYASAYSDGAESPTFAIYKGELTSDESSNYTEVKRFVGQMNALTHGKFNVALIDSNNYINGVMHNDTMYLSKDTLSSDNWLNSSTENFIKTAVHEGTHASFGTVSNAMLFNFLSHDADLVSKVKQQAQAKGYNFDAQTLEQINTKLQQGQELTQQETDLFNEYQDEISAQMAAEVLGNKKFMQRFTLSQRSAAAKVLNRIMAVADALSALKSTKARAEYLRYKTAAKLWTSALAEIGAHYSNGNIIFNDKDEESGTEDSANGTQFSLKGTDSNGIEIYETSEDIRSLSNAEKRKLFVQQMRNEFRGRTAKFTVDGETYYARFAHADVQKLAYGDKNSDASGKSAKLNAEASGDIFDLVENATYWRSAAESGKNIQAHKKVVSWDYFVKTVQIDGVKYDELINVRKLPVGEYVYDVSLNEKVVPSPSSSTKSTSISSEETTSTDSIRKNSENVNTSDKKSTKFSLKDSADLDRTYLRAIENEDNITVQKLVADAAQRAGYTDLVYHGTESFGFTEFNKDKSRDGISFFVTSSLETAQTYSGENGVRLLSDERKLELVDGNTSESDLMQYLQDLYDISAMKLADTEINKRFVSQHVYLDAVSAAEEILNNKYGKPTKSTTDLAQQVADLRRTENADSWKYIAKQIRGIDPTAMPKMHYTLESSVYKMLAKLQQIDNAYSSGLYEIQEQGRKRYEDRPQIERWVNEKLSAANKRGNYQLFAMPGKQLVLDAKGNLWRHIPIDNKLMPGFNSVRQINGAPVSDTQSIAIWAKNNGYDSVKITNVLDYGAHASNDAKDWITTDVYAYFDANRLKSADTILYDSDGKIIPLSERFNSANSDIRFSLKGTDSDGIEIYETSEEIRSLSNAEKRKLFVQQMRNEFRGRTAKFTVDGETYYARFAHEDVNKLAYGDKRSDIQGRAAKLNIEADGDIFDLTENAKYYASTDEREGKNGIAHNGVTSWDYFVKTVKVDNAVYDVVINVRESNGNKFVYDIAMRINKKITPSLSMSSTESALVSNEEVTSTNSIRNNLENVNTSDKKSTKFSLKDSVNKVYYRKKDIRRILDDVVSDLYSDSLVVDMTNKTRDNIIDEYQSKFNSTPQSRHLAIALDMAQFILDNVTATSIFESEYNSERIENATNTLAVLRRYLRRLNLSQADMRSEIKYKHDNNTLKVYARWSHRGGNGKALSVDTVAQELRAEGINITADNEYDILNEINDKYEKALAALKTQTSSALRNAFADKAEFDRAKSDLARALLVDLDGKGINTKYDQLESKYLAKIADKDNKIRELKRVIAAANSLQRSLRTLAGLKSGEFVRAIDYKNDMFNSTLGSLTKLNRGDYARPSTREIIADLRTWYTSADNPLVMEYNAWSQNHKQGDLFSGYYRAEIAAAMETIATGEGRLTATELELLNNIVLNANYIVKNYNKVLRNGEWVNAVPLAKQYVAKVQNSAKIRQSSGFLRYLSNNGFIRTFGDTESVAQMADSYQEGGFYTDMYHEFRAANQQYKQMLMELTMPFDEFYNKNKNYAKRLAEEALEYNGNDIPVSVAMSLYLTLGRKQAIKGLAQSGYQYVVARKGKRRGNNPELVRIKGFAEPGTEYTDAQLESMAKAVADDLYGKFSETDREYIKLVSATMEQCRDVKYATDIARMGYSNVVQSNYYPIRRANIAHGLDDIYEEIDRVSNMSFNKDSVKGAAGEIIIEGIDVVTHRHMDGIAKYGNLAIPIETFKRLYNMDVARITALEDGSVYNGKPVNIQTETRALTPAKNSIEKYFTDLIEDIQGIHTKRDDFFFTAVNRLRNGYAIYQLAANPKVWVTQISSWFAAISQLHIGSMVSGLGIRVTGTQLDKYCSLAQLRNYENAAAYAQGVLDKTNKAGEVLMKPIGMMDRLIIKKLFGACQVEVARYGGPAVGSEENLQKAGEKLAQVIYETQQNALVTERTAAARSDSEILKGLTMFSADSNKVLFRFVDALAKTVSLRTQLKSVSDQQQRNAIESQLKVAKTDIVKTATAISVVSVFMAAVTSGFKWLYNKDDDENAQTFMLEVIGNFLGGLPLVRDIYTYFTQNYELNNYAISTVNEMMSSVKSIGTLLSDAISGKPVDEQSINRDLRNALYAVGMCTGIPFRNVNNFVSGIIRRISPSTGYKIDNLTYQQSYTKDLADAVNRGDENMVDTIIGLVINENVGNVSDKAVRDAINSVTLAGYSALPNSVPDTITHDGAVYELTARQTKQFQTIYSQANDDISRLVKSSAFTSANAEQQAQSINFIWDYYYNTAKEEVLNIDLQEKKDLFAVAIPLDKLAIAYVTAKSLTADNGASKKEKVQKYIQSLSLTAAQKYMLMGYCGYTNVYGYNVVANYIDSLLLTDEEKAQLLLWSGYTENAANNKNNIITLPTRSNTTAGKTAATSRTSDRASRTGRSSARSRTRTRN